MARSSLFKRVVTVAKEQVVTMFLRGIFRSANDHREKRICDVRHDHADGVCFLFGEAARNQVRTIIQFANGDFHAIAKLFAYVAFLVDHLGYGKDRDGGFTRHVVDAGGFGPYWFWSFSFVPDGFRDFCLPLICEDGLIHAW